MTMQDLTGKRVKINKSTITLLGDAGKPAGMITGVDTFYNVHLREQFDFTSRATKLGIDRLKIDWARMFLVKGVWYYLADDTHLARAYEFQAIDGMKPIAKLEDGRMAADQFGATIIHVKSIYDGRNH